MKLKAGQFYGMTAETLAARDFRFTEKSYSTNSKLPVHSHELSHFCFVLSGHYEEKIGSRSFERIPSALVFYPPDTSHAESHTSDGRHFLIETGHESFARVSEYGARLTEPIRLESSSALWLAGRMYKEFVDRDKYSPLALESISTELLIAASRHFSTRAERRPPKWLAKVKEFLHENYSEPPGLNEMSEAVGVHATHLARVFRQFEHCTAGDYVRRIRIEAAQKKLSETDQPIVKIALDTGFADHAHLTRSFKRVTGMTPTEFRRVFRH